MCDIVLMVYEIEETEIFSKWFYKLKDLTAKRRILARFARIENGNFGDWSDTSENNVFELRFFFGPGYRIYYTIKGNKVVLLLNGGDKNTQNKDINKASEILKELE